MSATTTSTCPLLRSHVDASIDEALRAFTHFGVALPPYARWTIDNWRQVVDSFPTVAKAQAWPFNVHNNMLGWDVTDFGSGDFARIGRVLFTLRNSDVYCEKVIYNPPFQRAPAHFHRQKREDIINRAGNDLAVQLNNIDRTPLVVHVDGFQRRVDSNEPLVLSAGQSVTIMPGVVHQFWATNDGVDGGTISGEVSTVCDDRDDNVFVEPTASGFAETNTFVRFPPIVEDVPRRYILCHEYATALLAETSGTAK